MMPEKKVLSYFSQNRLESKAVDEVLADVVPAPERVAAQPLKLKTQTLKNTLAYSRPQRVNGLGRCGRCKQLLEYLGSVLLYQPMRFVPKK